MVCFLKSLAAISIVTLSFIVFFVDVEPETSMALEKWIVDRWATLTSLGTLVLVGFLTIGSTHIANTAAERREASNRSISAELKIVEFRQQWINGLRDDISEFLSLSGDKLSSEALDRVHLLNVRIMLRLNPTEDLTRELMTDITAILSAMNSKNSKELQAGQTQMQMTSSAILKGEWDKLKLALKTARISVGQ
jgi:hypothetical protein